MRTTSFVTGDIYHICNRSTEGISILRDFNDAKRFLKTLDVFNTTGEGLRGFARHPRKKVIHTPLVEVYTITLMPNHFHLMVKQLMENGISRWMQRSCSSFSHSFNLVHDRKGSLFMGPFRAISVLEDEQLFHLLVYIHANPLDLIFPQWREGGVRNWQEAKNFLKTYRFSSLGLYHPGFEVAEEIKTLVNPKPFQKFLSEWGGIEKGIRDWSSRDFEDMQALSLE